MSKQIAVLGLGRFGTSVAVSLAERGVEVMGVDIDPERVADIAPRITHAVQADIMDSDALNALGLRNFDVVILSIKDVETSCISAIAIKDRGAKYVVAQAGGESHAKILERIGADSIIMPEKDMGFRLARNLAGSHVVEYIGLSDKHSLAEINALDEWVGYTIKESSIRQKYGVNVVAIKSGDKVIASPGADQLISGGDIVVVIGENERIESLNRQKKRK